MIVENTELVTEDGCTLFNATGFGSALDGSLVFTSVNVTSPLASVIPGIWVSPKSVE